jgi:hypothetical protein
MLQKQKATQLKHEPLVAKALNPPPPKARDHTRGTRPHQCAQPHRTRSAPSTVWQTPSTAVTCATETHMEVTEQQHRNKIYSMNSVRLGDGVNEARCSKLHEPLWS